MILDCLSKKPFSVVGHRGSSEGYQENTIAAIEHAIKVGADLVEVDVRSTKDGVLVLSHDKDLKRVFGMDMLLREVDYKQVKEKLPTLEEVLEVVNGRVCMLLEIKEADIVDSLVKLIQKLGVQSWCAIISFDDQTIRMVKELLPDIITGLVYAKPPGRIFDAKKLGCKLVVPHWKIATKKANDKSHQLGLKVIAWTVNDEETALECYQRGVDAIATDFPSMLVKLRESLL